MPKKNASALPTVAISGHSEDRLFPPAAESCELSVACYRTDFSASRIAHAVEDADAHLLNMNVTSEVQPSGEITVDLRISHRNGGSAARSLERYGYRVVSMSNAIDRHADLTRERIDGLLMHLEI